MIQPRDVRLRRCAGDARQFAVGGVRRPVHAAESPAAGDFRIEDEQVFWASRKPKNIVVVSDTSRSGASCRLNGPS